VRVDAGGATIASSPTAALAVAGAMANGRRKQCEPGSVILRDTKHRRCLTNN
jgi:hypothetical protein